VGLYVSAYRLLDAAFLAPLAYLGSASSQLSRFVQKKDDAYRDLARTIIRNVSLYTFICVAVIVVYPNLPAILLGKKFIGSAPVLRVLILMLLPYAFAKTFAYILVAIERQTLDLISNIFRTVISIVLNMILIPRYGSMGAAMAAVAAMCVFCALETYFVRDLIHNLKIGRSLALSLVAALGAALLTMAAIRVPFLLIGISIILVAGIILFIQRKRRTSPFRA
jgi:O-antigen/teichoic acid export membrane protein